MPLLLPPRSPACILAPLLVVGLAAGCGSHTGHAAADGAAATHAATTPDSIAQTSWTLIRWTSSTGQARPTQARSGTGQATQGQAAGALDRPIKLDFLAQGNDYLVAGFSGCNAYQGRYALAHGKLSIIAPAATRMACSAPEVVALERDYLKALAAIKVFRLDSGGTPRVMTLTLEGGDTLEFTRGEDLPTRK